MRERQKGKREGYWQKEKERETHTRRVVKSGNSLERLSKAVVSFTRRLVCFSAYVKLNSPGNFTPTVLLHFRWFPVSKLRERERERKRDLFDIAQITFVAFFLPSSFDRLPSYEDDISKAPSVYEDPIAAEGPSRTMIRASSLVPRSHPQICRISKPMRIWHRAYCTFPDRTHY